MLRIFPPIFVVAALALPTTTSGQEEASSAPFSMSVINSEGTEAEVDLLTAELSIWEHEVTLLERRQLSLLTDEAILTESGFSQVASASLVLLVESFETEEAPFLATRAVEGVTGRILWADFRAREGDLEDWIDTVKAKLATFSHSPKQGPLVSLQGLHREFEVGVSELDLEAIALGRLVASELGKKSEITILERFDLGPIEFERFLTKLKLPEYARPDFLVSGTFQVTGEIGRARLRIRGVNSSTIVQIEVDTKTGGMPQLAREIGISLAETIGERADLDPSAMPQRPRLDEVAFARDEAERSFRLGLYELSAKQAEVADLIDQKEDPAIDLLRLYAHLFSLFPSLPGVNINNGALSVFGTSQDGADLDLWETYQFQKEEYPPQPTADELSSFAGFIEALADYLDQMSPESANSSHSRSRDLLERLHRVIDPFLEELAWAAYATRESDSSGEIEPQLLRLGEALHRFHKLESERLPGSYHYPQNLFTLPLLLGPAEKGIAHLESQLYSDHFSNLPDLQKSAYFRRMNQFKSYRISLFQFLGLKTKDSALVVAGEEFADHRIVGGLSGSAITPMEAVRIACEPREDAMDPVRELDLAIASMMPLEAGEQRDQAYAEALQLFEAHSEALAEKGLLGGYAVVFLHLDNNHRYGGGLYTSTENAVEFWKKIHQKAYEASPWGELQFSTYLKPIRKPIPYFEENPGEAVKMMEAMLSDIEQHNETAAAGGEISVSSFQKDLETLVGVRDTLPEGLQGIGEEENIDVTFLEYAYWYAPKIDFQLAEKYIFLLQHDVRRPEADAHIVVFDLSREEDRRLIDLPRSLSDIFFDGRSHPSGGMQIRKDAIVIAGPGAIGIYDRKKEEWKITRHEFLEGKQGFRIIGNQVLFHGGTGHSQNPGPPVQGLYGLDLDSGKIVTYIDTTRRPTINLYDSARSLQFPSPLLPLGEKRFIARVHGFRSHPSILKFDLGSPDDDTQPIPLAIPFPIEPIARTHGHAFGDLSTMVMLNRLVKPATYPDPSNHFQVFALAMKPGASTPTWLLASEAPEGSPGSTIPVTHNPLYEFPEEFSVTGSKFTHPPVIWHDGTRLLFLSPQLASENKRILYYWKEPNSGPPARITLDFNSLRQYGPEGMSMEERTKRETSASRSIDGIAVAGDLMIFEINYGYYLLPMKNFRDHLDQRSLR